MLGDIQKEEWLNCRNGTTKLHKDNTLNAYRMRAIGARQIHAHELARLRIASKDHYVHRWERLSGRPYPGRTNSSASLNSGAKTSGATSSPSALSIAPLVLIVSGEIAQRRESFAVAGEPDSIYNREVHQFTDKKGSFTCWEISIGNILGKDYYYFKIYDQGRGYENYHDLMSDMWDNYEHGILQSTTIMTYELTGKVEQITEDQWITMEEAAKKKWGYLEWNLWKLGWEFVPGTHRKELPEVSEDDPVYRAMNPDMI